MRPSAAGTGVQRIRSGGRIVSSALIALLFASSLWLRQGFPIFALGFAGHDDRLFVQMASSLLAGEWLGPYGPLTLAKGMAYSLFMALNQPTGIPFKTTEHCVYLLSSLYFATTLGSVFGRRTLVVATFALLALNPVVWNNWVAGRVMREGLYVSLSLLLVATAIRCFLLERHTDIEQDNRSKRWLLAGLGVLTAAFWLTREEGLWLAPALSIVACAPVARRWQALRAGSVRARQMLVLWAIPALVFALVVVVVNSIHYRYYKTFRNNDLRSSDFQAAYGALARIRHDRWEGFVVFPRDARERAYAVSSAARELKPYFEGRGAELWQHAGCKQTGTDPCPEILAGWFVWALRDAVAAAGHYGRARSASAYYRRLAREINDACDAAVIPCGPRRSSLVPPWRDEYLPATLRAASKVFLRLATLDTGNPAGSPYVTASLGTEQELALFQRITNGPLASADSACVSPLQASADPAPAQHCSGSDAFRLALAKRIDEFVSGFNTVALPLAIMAWPIVLGYAAIQRRRWHPGQFVAAALLAAVLARVGLLGFLDATSMPADNMLYLWPVVPLALALGPCVVWLALEQCSVRSAGPSSVTRDG